MHGAAVFISQPHLHVFFTRVPNVYTHIVLSGYTCLWLAILPALPCLCEWVCLSVCVCVCAYVQIWQKRQFLIACSVNDSLVECFKKSCSKATFVSSSSFEYQIVLADKKLLNDKRNKLLLQNMSWLHLVNSSVWNISRASLDVGIYIIMWRWQNDNHQIKYRKEKSDNQDHRIVVQ